jgi:hypothetical protein
VKPLSAAAVALALLMGPAAFLLHRYGGRVSGRPSSRRATPEVGPLRMMWARTPAPAERLEEQKRIRRDTWETVSRFCVDRADVVGLRERYLVMSKTAAREQFSSAFRSQITYLAAVSMTHLLVYSYLAHQVAQDVTSARSVMSGWWATFPLFASSAVAVLIISLVNSRPIVVIFTFSCVGSALCLAGIRVTGSGVHSNTEWLAFFTGGTLVLLAADSSIVALAAASIRQKLWTYRAADTHVFADLQMALYYLGTDGALRDLATCARVARLLDTAATCAETGLYRALSLQYGPSSLVVKSRLEGAARRLRGYQTWVALPNTETTRELERELSQFLVVLCSREYDSLPWLARSANAIPQGIRKAVSTLRTLITAAVPLIVIKVAEEAGAIDSGPISQGLVLLSVIWLLAGVFTIADPLLGPHLSALKDLVGAVRSLGGGEK